MTRISFFHYDVNINSLRALPRRQRSIAAPVDYKNILMIKGDIARLWNASSRRGRRGRRGRRERRRRGRPRTPAPAPTGSSVPAGSVPPYKTWMNDCLVFLPSVPFGRNKCAAFRRASRVQPEKKQRRMSQHIPVTTASGNRVGQDEHACTRYKSSCTRNISIHDKDKIWIFVIYWHMTVMNHHIPWYTYTVIYRHMTSYTFRESIYRDILSTEIREKYIPRYTRYMTPYDRAWDMGSYTEYMWSYDGIWRHLETPESLDMVYTWYILCIYF